MERWGGHTRLHNKTLGNQFQNTFFLKFFRDQFIGGKHGGVLKFFSEITTETQMMSPCQPAGTCKKGMMRGLF